MLTTIFLITYGLIIWSVVGCIYAFVKQITVEDICNYPLKQVILWGPLWWIAYRL